MGIKNPSEEVIQAVEAAIAWFNNSKIEGIRIERVPLQGKDIINNEYPYDNVVVKDETAPAIWSRFMNCLTTDRLWPNAPVKRYGNCLT